RNDSNHSPPVIGFFGQLPPARFCNLEELGFAVVFRYAPLGPDKSALLQSDESRIDRALIKEQNLIADLFDSAGDSPAVQRPHTFKRLQNHQVQRSLQDLRSVPGHVDLLLIFNWNIEGAPVVCQQEEKRRRSPALG